MNITEKDVQKRKVPLLVGYGGGVNSFAVLIAMRQRGIIPDLITFANTGGAKSEGGEKPETYAYIKDHFKPWLARVGLPALVEVINESPQAGDGSLEEESLRRETLPSRAFGMSSCAMRWKIAPQEKFLNHWPPAVKAWAKKKRVIKVLGYDGGEDARAKIFEDAKFFYWYPLIEWDIDRDGCEKLIRDEGLPVPVKSACFYCPSSTKTEVIQLHRKHPALFERACEMESRALESDKHTLRNIRGLGRNWSWSELISMKEDERARLQEAPVESCMICHDGGGDD